MSKLFLCLAKSRKYSGRCVAGIVVERDPWRKILTFQRDARGNPVWIRPLGPSKHGAIDPKIGDELHLLNVYEIDRFRNAAEGYQSENVLHPTQQFRPVTFLAPHRQHLELCRDRTPEGNLFVNRRRSISATEILSLDRSIKLILAKNPRVYVRDMRLKGLQYRIHFEYDGTEYDLSMTDLDFRTRFDANPTLLDRCAECYLVVSISKSFEGRYYKLVATVLLSEVNS